MIEICSYDIACKIIQESYSSVRSFDSSIEGNTIYFVK